jgi:hypothetical protein
MLGSDRLLTDKNELEIDETIRLGKVIYNIWQHGLKEPDK